LVGGAAKDQRGGIGCGFDQRKSDVGTEDADGRREAVGGHAIRGDDRHERANSGGSWVTTATKYIRDTNRAWNGTYVESTATTAEEAVDGRDYVVFRGLTDPTFRISATVGTRRGGISGFQIVEQVAVQTGSAPEITSALEAAGVYGAPFSYTIGATEDATEFAATGLPAGLSIDSETGIISGTPEETGTFEVDLSATNDTGTGVAVLTLTIERAAQTITVAEPEAKTFGDAPFALAASSSAGLPVSYSVVSGPATIDGDVVTLIGAGTVVVAVEQPGDANYLAAESVTLTFEVAKASQTISFATPASKTFGDAPFALTASASSGLPVSFAVVSGPATVAGDQVTLIGTGTVTLLASQSGNADYLAAGSVSVSFTVSAAAAAITLDALDQLYDGAPKSASVATTPAGLEVIVTYNGVENAPVFPGSYDVVATVVDPNYTGGATGTLVISSPIVVRRAPVLNGLVESSIQVLQPESIALNSSAAVSGDLLVPGTPKVVRNGNPMLADILSAGGNAAPETATITLNSGSVLRYLVRQTDPVALPTVSAPASPAGTRNVSVNNAAQNERRLHRAA